MCGEAGPLSEPEMKGEGKREREKKGRKAGWQEGGRKGQKERREGGKEERNLSMYHIYFPLSKTQAGYHSIKAITLALLATLEIKLGLLKLYTQKPVG